MKRMMFVVATVALFALGAGARGAADNAKAGKLTSEDVLKDCANAYKSMRTYYDKSTVETKFTLGTDSFEKKAQMTVAFKRPSDLKISVTGDQNMTFYADDKKVVVYIPKQNVYVDLESRSRVVEVLKRAAAFIAAVALSDDPYHFMKEAGDNVGELETTNLDGREVYRVRLTHGQDFTDMYFDKDRHIILAITAGSSQETPKGTVKINISTKVNKVLINEFPKDAEGKNIDMLSFALPKGAKKYDPKAEAARKYKCYLLKDKPAPDFTLPDLEGRQIHLADLKGKVVLLDFWAIWCGPCVEEIPQLVKLAGIYKDKPFVYYAINDDASAKDIQAFAKKNNLAIPALVAKGTSISSDYEIVAIPTLFILDKKGIVREVSVGLTPAENLRGVIDKLLAQEPKAPPEK